jgi:C4-dicarboxylate transporter, DctM subunit
MDYATLITLIAVALFLTGTPVLLVISGWVIATSYFVVEFPLINVGLTANEAVQIYVFLAVPLFVATGDLLTAGGISKKLVTFARSTVPFLPGATAATTMVSCGLFSAVSGSNAATAATMGRLLGPELDKQGVDRGLSAALVAAGGTVGVIIPPSVMFRIYAVTVDVSSVDLFVGGIIPGLLMVFVLVSCAVFLTHKNEPSKGFRSLSIVEIGSNAVKAWMGFIAIGIILFGIYWGYFSPTEAAGVVTLYCMIAAVFMSGELKLRELPKILLQSAQLTGMIVPLVVFSVQFQQVASVMGLPELLQNWITELGAIYSPSLSILIMMGIILMVGAITESTAVVLILGPILAPIADHFGIDPIHWGVIFVVGTTIGFITPPYGLNLFVVSGVMGVPYPSVMRNILKILIPLILLWVFITWSPWTATLLLPNS